LIGHELTEDARHVRLLAGIYPRYKPLLREGSRWWIVSGVDFKVGWKGAKFRTKPLEALIRGGVAFRTPEDSPQATPGHEYQLSYEIDPKWLKWSPSISIKE